MVHKYWCARSWSLLINAHGHACASHMKGRTQTHTHAAKKIRTDTCTKGFPRRPWRTYVLVPWRSDVAPRWSRYLSRWPSAGQRVWILQTSIIYSHLCSTAWGSSPPFGALRLLPTLSSSSWESPFIFRSSESTMLFWLVGASRTLFI